MERHELLRLVRLTLLALCVGLALTAAFLADLLPATQAGATDFLFNRPPGPSAPITIVALDARSDKELFDNRPLAAFPGEEFAQLLDALVAAGARTIALDVLFELEDPSHA